jgi:uncharacterized protein YdeI (YjbR/CyaY-like superfamily)
MNLSPELLPNPEGDRPSAESALPSRAEKMPLAAHRTPPSALPMPNLLIEALDGDAELQAWLGTLSEAWQREIARWVLEPKSDEARQRRCDAMAERLLLAMEAERELPVFLKRRLERTGDALSGWERMTLSCRQTYLLVLFGTKSPEAREKQIVALVQACVDKGRKPVRSVKPFPAADEAIAQTE